MPTITPSGGITSLRTVLISVLLVFVALCVGLIVYHEDNLQKEVRAETDRDLARLTGHGRSILLNDITQYRDNLYFLHATPPISGLTRANANGGIDPYDGTKFAQWKLRLETIFVSMLQNNQEIDQLRVVLANETGKELIRVDRLSGKIDVISGQWLQEKAATEYYKASVALKPGQLYLSRINLNREYGQIEYPIRPTVRLSTPIFDDAGNRFGFLIMNVNANTLLEDLRRETIDQFNLILTDNEGYYIDHPLVGSRFSRDLAPEHNWLTEHRLDFNREGSGGIATKLATNESFPFHQMTVQLTADPEAVMHVYAVTQPSWVADQLLSRRVATYGFSGLALLFLCVILGLFTRGYQNSMHLSSARAEYEAIINGSSAAIIGLEMNGKITSCNDAALSLLRSSRASVIGQNIATVGLFDDVDFDEKIEKVRSTKSSVSLETTFAGPRHTDIDLAVTFSPIVIENRELAGIAIIARNITREKAAEREIKAANAALETEVAKRTEELAEAHKKALHASDMKSSFISHVSHEMRTPLNGLSGSLNLIKREPLTKAQAKYLEMAEISSSTLGTLINDILDLSKIEAGKLDFENNPFDPVALFESVAQSFSIRTREKNISLLLDTTGLLHDQLYGDVNRLKQVLNNLISNATKFTSKGHVAISAATRVEGDRIRLDVSVEDSGIGIAAENKHKLFTAFSQEDSSVATNFGGTGLGLLICKQLCLRMDGDIGLESEKGVGSTFFFHIYFDAENSSTRDVPAVLKDKSIQLEMNQAKAQEYAGRIVKSLGGTLIDTTDNDAASPDMVITDYAGDRVVTLCARFEAGHSNPATLPTIFLVKGEDRNKPNYAGHIAILTVPLTQTGLVSQLDTPGVQTPSAAAAKPADTIAEPVTAPGSVIQVAPEKNNALNLSHINVLIVDDNDINLAVARGFLGSTKANIQTAHNGVEAIEALRQAADSSNNFHCILMDCQMPGMDGYETTNLIRSGKVVEALADIPIIAMTASAMSGERDKCLAAGMTDYITKPIQSEILIDRVNHWSHRHLPHEAGE
ncbi:MAG: ATP-binding protein [Thalassospira sp.]|uniref:ATP-binding protein n=1 Tax=Thalassospira sp. TaxID=1912094 RepID=UPI003A8428B0